MKFDKDFASIHAYLSADGYVVRNPKEQKHNYYHIGFRNTNEILLKDFQKRFFRKFRIKPRMPNDRCIVQSKDLYFKLTEDFSFYSHKWRMPELSKENKKLWLRAFFDCEGWVELQRAKNRSVRMETTNMSGMKQIKEALSELGIKSSLKETKRGLCRLNICGRENLEKFCEEINFLHPEKKIKLKNALESYRNLEWDIPQEKEELIRFIKKKGGLRKNRNEIRLFTTDKKNLSNLKVSLDKYNIKSKISGPWKNKHSIYYCMIIKETEVK